MSGSGGEGIRFEANPASDVASMILLSSCNLLPRESRLTFLRDCLTHLYKRLTESHFQKGKIKLLSSRVKDTVH